MNALSALILAPILTGICIPAVAYFMGKTGFVKPFDIEFGRFKWEIRPWQLFTPSVEIYSISILSDAVSANNTSEAVSDRSLAAGRATISLIKVKMGRAGWTQPAVL